MSYHEANRVIDVVSDYYGVPRERVAGRHRKKSKTAIKARKVSQYLIRERTDLSLPEIAEIFGVDHSTVIKNTGTLRRLENA